MFVCQNNLLSIYFGEQRKTCLKYCSLGPGARKNLSVKSLKN